MSCESESADVFDFVDAYLVDLERGGTHPLAYWLERFPRSQAAVAREWLSLSAVREPGSAAQNGGAGGGAQVDGEVRLGPYRVLRELGRGGQGAVHLAEDTRIARRVALKVLSTSFDSVSDEKRQRFRREADVIARLEHPGLCTIHDADLTGERPWIAMRFVEGRTLADCLAEAKAAGGAAVFGLRFPPRTTAELHAVLLLFERAARALHAAHEAGVVHRDVKPGNMIVAIDGRPVLLDFGLARDDESQVGTITQSGDLFGTPAYMSPEQLSVSSGELDRRTDVYSLGVALFEALTLARPFDHAVRTVLYRQILEEPVPDARKRNPALPADVQVVLETALEKDRDRRYATALELAEDLRRIRQYEPIHARPATVSVRFARWTRRHPALAVATIGTILSLSIGLAVTLRLLANERRALEFAVGRQLALRAEALAHEDPPVALALGIAAVERAPNDLTRSSLLTALDACWLARAIDPPEGDRIQVRSIAASSGSDAGAIGYSDGTVKIVDIHSGTSTMRLEGRTAGIASLAFDAAGERLVSADVEGTVTVHDTSSGLLLHELHADPPYVLARFAPDGGSLLLVSSAGDVDVVDGHTFSGPTRLISLPNPITSAGFSPDGRLLLVHAPALDPIVLDARSGTQLRVIAAEPKAAVCAFVPQATGEGIVLARTDGTIAVLDTLASEAVDSNVRVEGTPTALVPSADGRYLVVLADAAEDGWAWWCDLELGRSRRIEEHDGHRVTQAVFSPDGARFATASFDNTIRIFDTATGEEVRALRLPLRQLGAVWSRDGNRLLARTQSGFAQLWYSRARPDVFDLEGHTAAIRSVEFAPDGETALTASEDGTARLWRTPRQGDGRDAGRVVAVLRHSGPLLHAAFSAQGRIAFTAAACGEAGTFDASSGAPLRSVARHQGALIAAAIDARGEQFVTACADGIARLWAARSDKPPLLLAGPSQPLTSVAFSHDGQLLAVGTAEDEVRIHDARDGRLVRMLDMDRERKSSVGVLGLVFNPTTAELAVACGDNCVRFVDATTGEPTRSFQDPVRGGKERDGWLTFPCRSLAFSADGTHVLVAGRTGGSAVRSKRLTMVAPGKRVLEPDAYTDPRTPHARDLTSAVYDSRGTVVLTTSKDRTACVWKAADGVPITRMEGYSSSVTCGALWSAGTELRAITGCADGSVSVWPVDPLPAARARLPRPLAKWEMAFERELALPLEVEFR